MDIKMKDALGSIRTKQESSDDQLISYPCKKKAS